MKFVLTQNPIAKARHRYQRKGNQIITFDPQHSEKINAQWHVAKQMSEKGHCLASDGPLFMSLINYTPMPQSWSQRRCKAFEGQGCMIRPDIDNYVKFYCDVLNEVAYHDDKQITRLWSEKIYSSNPRVEITIQPITEKTNKEHVATIVGTLSDDLLHRLSEKANKLGLQNRKIVSLFSEDDDKGKHFYFEVEWSDLQSPFFTN